MDKKMAAAYGMEGGWSCSPAKRAAARLNGRKSKGAENNGRPRTRTLGEVLLRRKMDPADYAALKEAFVQLTLTEQDLFRQHYGFARGWGKNAPDMTTRDYRAASMASDTMRHVQRKMRLVANYRLGKK
jgi:hypothetical protein